MNNDNDDRDAAESECASSPPRLDGVPQPDPEIQRLRCPGERAAQRLRELGTPLPPGPLSGGDAFVKRFILKYGPMASVPPPDEEAELLRLDAEQERLRAEEQELKRLKDELERDHIPALKTAILLRDEFDRLKACRRKAGRPKVWGGPEDVELLRQYRAEHGRGKGDNLLEVKWVREGDGRGSRKQMGPRNARERREAAAAVLDG
jgi:hypothetical protein